MSEPSPPSYEFGPFSLDAGKRLLLRNGEPVALAPKVLETLLALVENRERVLTKDELLKRGLGRHHRRRGRADPQRLHPAEDPGREARRPPVHRHRAGPRLSVRGGGARKARHGESSSHRAVSRAPGSRWAVCASLVGLGSAAARRRDVHLLTGRRATDPTDAASAPPSTPPPTTRCCARSSSASGPPTRTRRR